MVCRFKGLHSVFEQHGSAVPSSKRAQPVQHAGWHVHALRLATNSAKLQLQCSGIPAAIVLKFINDELAAARWTESPVGQPANATSSSSTATRKQHSATTHEHRRLEQHLSSKSAESPVAESDVSTTSADCLHAIECQFGFIRAHLRKRFQCAIATAITAASTNWIKLVYASGANGRPELRWILQPQQLQHEQQLELVQ